MGKLSAISSNAIPFFSIVSLQLEFLFQSSLIFPLFSFLFCQANFSSHAAFPVSSARMSQGARGPAGRTSGFHTAAVGSLTAILS